MHYILSQHPIFKSFTPISQNNLLSFKQHTAQELKKSSFLEGLLLLHFYWCESSAVLEVEEEKEKRLTSKIKQKIGASFICHLCYLSALTYIFFPSLLVFSMLPELSTSWFLYSSLIFRPLYLSLYLLFPCLFFLCTHLTLKTSLRPAPSHMSAPLS